MRTAPRPAADRQEPLRCRQRLTASQRAIDSARSPHLPGCFSRCDHVTSAVEDTGFNDVFPTCWVINSGRSTLGNQGASGFFDVIDLNMGHDPPHSCRKLRDHGHAGRLFHEIRQGDRVDTLQVIPNRRAVCHGKSRKSWFEMFDVGFDRPRVGCHTARELAEDQFTPGKLLSLLPHAHQGLAIRFDFA